MKFTWGDEVKIKENAPEKYRPGEYGAVCGFWEIENDKVAGMVNYPIGTILYTIEYGDGTDEQIPEEYLEMAPDEYQPKK